MSDEVVDQKLKKRQEHIALSELATNKITSWIEQAATKKKGVRVSRKDFVNWLIEKSPDNLSGGDLNSLIERFYDEACFLRQLLREVQQAKKDGQTEPALEFIVRTRKSEQKKEVSLANEQPLENASDDEPSL